MESELPVDYIDLTKDERYHIDELQREGFSQAMIENNLADRAQLFPGSCDVIKVSVVGDQDKLS